MPDNESVDDILEEGSYAVIVATVLAIVWTVLERHVNHNEFFDAGAKAAWIVWAFVAAGWVALLILDYFVPIKVEPEIISGPDPELERLLAEEEEIQRRLGD